MRWAHYFDERVETMPPAWLRRLQEERLADQVARCYDGSPFYRRKLSQAHVRPEDIVRVEDVARIPLTTREEVRESQVRHPPLGGLGWGDPIDLVRIELGTATRFATASTRKDVRRAAEVGARALWACGIRPDDLVLDSLARDPGSRSSSEAVEAAGATVVPLSEGAEGWPLAIWQELTPSTLVATSSQVLDLAAAARERELEPRELGLRRIVVAEGLDGERPRLEEGWDADVRLAYGVPEIYGIFAGECEQAEGLHFLGHGAVLAELVDPESGEPIPIEPGGQGEAVYSHVDREATPLLRFRSGHVISILGLECPCGRSGFRFRLAGRA